MSAGRSWAADAKMRALTNHAQCAAGTAPAAVRTSAVGSESDRAFDSALLSKPTPSIATARQETATQAAFPRRRWLQRVAVAALCAMPGWRMATAGMGLSSYTVSLADLLAMLSERFPRSFPVAGIATLELRAPALALRPETNRLSARVPAVLSGPVLPEPKTGAMEVEFGLRYEPKDRTLRAHNIALQSLEIEGLDPAASTLLKAWSPRLARKALGEVVLHRLEEKDLALLDGLGMQPGAITVTPRGLAIAFERAPK